MPSHPTLTSSYRARAGVSSSAPLASYLLSLMAIKKTNLCLSADVETSAELLQLADDIGDSICVFKTHCDIVVDWSDRTAQALREIAKRKCFLLFEDRKFADIGETVQKQYTSGHHGIALWAHITNAHILPGPAIVTALKKAAEATVVKYNTAVHTEISASPRIKGVSGAGIDDDDDDDEEDLTLAESATDSPHFSEDEDHRLNTKATNRKHSVVSVTTSISTRTESISPHPGTNSSEDDVFNLDTAGELLRLGEVPFLRSLLLLAEMSSEGHMMTPEYQQNTLKIARDHRDFVIGFIAQRSLNAEPGDNFVTMTPGCQIAPAGQESKKMGDNLGQQYNTPRKLIFEQGSDVIIVGRGIVHAQDRKTEAERYRKAGWAAYEERIGQTS